ncbi:hypothetical protein HGRIS_011375 [Hohenbuehelia grisea]|uniref:CBS domain-containing protein n=1 Tax=Hohenbuehelia grisea TaxID=104357 RepID=A0ABR3JVZ9_9AGAR
MTNALNSRRLSQSFWVDPPASQAPPPTPDSEDWLRSWQTVFARDIIDSRVVSVDAETAVEDACDILLSEDTFCLAITSSGAYTGLFDFSDVNAFLTLAATRHTLQPEYLRQHSQVDSIVSAARAGHVPVRLVSNLSEKNPLKTLPNDANIVSLLEIFAEGAHRVLIKAPAPSNDFIGLVSDRRLLDWFSSYARDAPALQEYLSNSLSSLALPSLNIYTSVVATTSNSTVLDAMKLMSEGGVSSVAVTDEESGKLLSAVSVTDIGKIVVPSQSNQILSTPLHQFIAQIKAPDGSKDGVDKYPVYSVTPASPLTYTVQKLLATNAHRLFVTRESSGNASPSLTAANSGNLTGIVSVVDVLYLFARIANIPNLDPTRMQRHRRASSASSHSSLSEHELLRSRSNSRTSVRRSPVIPTSPGAGVSALELN